MQNCILHSSLLTHYCQTCRDPICQQCFPKHLLHAKFFITQAAETRKSRFAIMKNETITPLLLAAHNKLINNDKEILSQQLKMILKDIFFQFEGMQQRRNSKTNTQINKAQGKLKVLQKLKNSIDDVSYAFQNAKNKPITLLKIYRQLKNTINTLKTIDVGSINSQTNLKFFKQSSQSNYQSYKPYFPNDQFAETVSHIELLSDYKSHNQFLSKLIRCLIVNYHKAKAQFDDKKITKYKDTILQYVKYKHVVPYKVCVFCGVCFSNYECNEACAYNKARSSKPLFQMQEYEKKQFSNLLGTKSHFWVDGREIQIPKIDTHILLRNAQKKNFQSCLKGMAILQVYVKEYQLREDKKVIQLLQECAKNNILQQEQQGQPVNKQIQINMKELSISQNNIQQALTQFVKLDKYITKITLMYVLRNKLKIPQRIIRLITQILSQKNQWISLTKFAQLVEDPLVFYQNFVKLQEQNNFKKPVAPSSSSLKFRY